MRGPLSTVSVDTLRTRHCGLAKQSRTITIRDVGVKNAKGCGRKRRFGTANGEKRRAESHEMTNVGGTKFCKS